MLLLLLLFSVAFARRPTCAVLFCTEEEHSNAWIAGAEDEFVVLQQTLFGGFLPSGARTSPCLDCSPQLDALVCLKPDALPPANCYARFCDFWRHIELYDQHTVGCIEPKNVTNTTNTPTSRDRNVHRYIRPKHEQVCRTLRAWSALGIEKLNLALGAFDSGNFADATSFACVAEQLLELVNSRLHSPFIDSYKSGDARYQHQALPASLVNFALDEPEVPSVTIETRTLRSYRRWDTTNYTLIATFVLVGTTSMSEEERNIEKEVNGQIQLLWPVSGVVLPFDKSSLPEQNICSVDTVESELADSVAPLAELGSSDFGVAVDQYRTCRQFPGQTEFSAVRHYDELSPTSSCGMIVVSANLMPASDLSSLAYVAHGFSSATFEELPADPKIETKLVVRVASANQCTDTLGTAMPANPTPPSPPANVTAIASLFGAPTLRRWREPRPGVPMTLAPGESVCIGGDLAGVECSVESECGTGRTCRTMPGTQGRAYCFDRTRFVWFEQEPCALADGETECPYGYCYGAVDGHEGGAYPLLHVWREAHCDASDGSAGDECNVDEVRQWYLYPTRDSVQ